MTPKQAKPFGLRILTAWRRDTVWMVQHQVCGETHCRWFRREETAMRYASMISDAVVESIHYKIGSTPQLGFVEDQIRDVVHP